MGTSVQVTNNDGKGGTIVSIIVIVILLSVSGFLYVLYNKANKELKTEQDNKEKLSQSMNALSDSCKTYQIKWGKDKKLWAAKVQTLYMEKQNVSTILSDKASDLKRMGIKLKDVSSLAYSNTRTHDSVTVPVYIDSIKSLHADYKDNFVDISATIYRDMTSSIRYESRDSFTLVNYISYKRFLFFKWGRKDVFLLTAKNPKTKVEGLKIYQILK
jgi:hypothetical protein